MKVLFLFLTGATSAFGMRLTQSDSLRYGGECADELVGMIHKAAETVVSMHNITHQDELVKSLPNYDQAFSNVKKAAVDCNQIAINQMKPKVDAGFQVSKVETPPSEECRHDLETLLVDGKTALLALKGAFKTTSSSNILESLKDAKKVVTDIHDFVADCSSSDDEKTKCANAKDYFVKRMRKIGVISGGIDKLKAMAHEITQVPHLALNVANACEVQNKLKAAELAKEVEHAQMQRHCLFTQILNNNRECVNQLKDTIKHLETSFDHSDMTFREAMSKLEVDAPDLHRSILNAISACSH